MSASVDGATDWYAANKAYLLDALGWVRALVEAHVASEAGNTRASASRKRSRAAARPVASADESGLSPPAALESLVGMFGLSGFERSLLVLCAGVELEAGIGALCAEAQGVPERTHASFGLALAAFPDAHWSALSPEASLRYWRLVEVSDERSLTTSALRIDERILNYLVGVEHLDQRLSDLLTTLEPRGSLAESHRVLALRAADVLHQSAGQSTPVELCGPDAASKLAVAHACARALGMELVSLSSQIAPSTPKDIEDFARRWTREAALAERLLLIDAHETDRGERWREVALDQLIERLGCALLVSSRQRRRIATRQFISLDVAKPTAAEQRDDWMRVLGEAGAASPQTAARLSAQFDLDAASLHTVAISAYADLDERRASDPQTFGQCLWRSCRQQARPQLDELATRITTRAGWDDLVLPAPEAQTLRDMLAYARNRAQVHEAWGFASKNSSGLGMTALFSGSSGTGKTMAASVLANELDLDLYRIDLSQVVNKYIGETEKNLRRVFDGAEEGGVVLLFDEADALFGKRSEVKDSHDRHANIEVSYLLQRMDAYRGVAILTTNMKDSLDTAFLRRLQFIVRFPFPDKAERAAIWARIFPAQTPTEGLDVERLAQLTVAGGHIRSIALHAAFLAADAGRSVDMTLMRQAARAEYTKLEKTLTANELEGWE